LNYGGELPGVRNLFDFSFFFVFRLRCARGGVLEFRRQYRAHRMTGSDARFGTVYHSSITYQAGTFSYSPSLGYIQLCCIYVVSKRVEALARLRGSLLSPE